jgi:hypothetical protein
MNIGELVLQYRNLRDELDARRKAYNAFEDETKNALMDLETQMLNVCAETGVDSFKTQWGTCFKTTKTYARLGAGEDCKKAREEYAIRTGDFGLFTSHVNKTHAKELMEAGENLAAIGIDWIEELSMSFRKPTN